jgi:hypothetical protein
MVIVPLIASLAAAGLPTDAPSSCAYDVPTATAQVQMLSARTTLRRAGDDLLRGGRSGAVNGACSDDRSPRRPRPQRGVR